MDFSNNCPGIVGVMEVKFSGLYSYHVATNTWMQLFDDCSSGIVKPGLQTLKSRAGHCMIFHPVSEFMYNIHPIRIGNAASECCSSRVTDSCLCSLVSEAKNF